MGEIQSYLAGDELTHILGKSGVFFLFTLPILSVLFSTSLHHLYGVAFFYSCLYIFLILFESSVIFEKNLYLLILKFMVVLPAMVLHSPR